MAPNRKKHRKLSAFQPIATPASSATAAAVKRNSDAAHAASCGLRRSSHRSSAESANANEMTAAEAARARWTFTAARILARQPPTSTKCSCACESGRMVSDVDDRRPKRIPDATVARLPVYLRSLLEIAGDATTVSSERLAEMAGVNAAKVRKDLSYLGSYGTRGVGYDVEYLLFQMSRELGLTQHWPVVIVGIGNLGHALANYGGFGASGV